MRYLILFISILFTFPVFSQGLYADFTPKEKNLVFLDNFDNNANRWWLGDNSEAYGAVEKGNYILEWRGKLPIWYSLAGVNFDFSKDFEIEASIKQTNGADGNLFGLIFDKSDNGEYGFIVNGRSESVVYQDIKNENRRFIKDGGEVIPDIKVTYNEYNKLTIRKIGGDIYFFVNEVFLKSGESNGFVSNKIGFEIWYNSRIYIDYLKVSYLKRVENNIVSEPIINKETANKNVKSDVDIDIPAVARQNPDRFALIIGNEDYSSKQKEIKTEINVDFARNDAASFKEYAIKVLGIPEQNITYLLDATLGEMSQGIDKMNKIIKVTDGTADVFFYYAGHGLPDENTKEAYLIPVDVNGTNLNYAINLKSVYSKLTEFPSQRVTVFLDACFSGGARNQGLLSARGVKVKPKEESLKGKLVVFTASSGEQSSLPYKAKNHGLFTYYLLKKLQETKGETTYKELSDYLNKTIKLNSILANDKEQLPQTSTSAEIQNEWMNWKIK
ncbi:MAG: caspase family protein [Bacteroidales bacterium]|nr:MAG: caspase family protein [Bacteroidales bacterium]